MIESLSSQTYATMPQCRSTKPHMLMLINFNTKYCTVLKSY